jgi:hypothetical protein
LYRVASTNKRVPVRDETAIYTARYLNSEAPVAVLRAYSLAIGGCCCSVRAETFLKPERVLPVGSATLALPEVVERYALCRNGLVVIKGGGVGVK